MSWRPTLPRDQRFIRIERDGRIAFCGYVTKAQPDGDEMRCTVTSPLGLVSDMPLRFRPPAVSVAADGGGAEYWWRLLQYVFDALADPCLFPPITTAPSDDDRSRLERFVQTSESLAVSGVMTEPIGVSVNIDKVTGVETVDATFPRIDLQIGFAALLRQCNSDEERASFKRVKDILWVLNESDADEHAEQRRTYLRAWYKAERKLRGGSLEQLFRDCFVAREGWSAFDYAEEFNPELLMSLFNYGDLIHWDRKADGLAAIVADEQSAAKQRHDFFDAVVGFAHLYIAFGQLVRAATTPLNQLLVP